MNRSVNRPSHGFSVVEALISVVIGAMVLVAAQQMLAATEALREEHERAHEGLAELDFAMQRMLKNARYSQRMLLPAPDRPASSIVENIREEVPGTTGSTAVFAVTLPASVDRNQDGIADADNDGDGRIDEDTPGDITNDAAPGIYLIDDDNDNSVDEGSQNEDDDEYLAFSNEDKLDGVDNDNDGAIDEDWNNDANDDGQPGVAGVDDDGDGSIDEGSVEDDDEDGQSDEDWLDPVVYYLDGTNLMERLPVPWDTDSDTDVDGRDFVTNTLLSNVQRFRVERVDQQERPYPLVILTVEYIDSFGQTHSLTAQIRVGSAA